MHSATLNPLEAFAKLPDWLQVFACSAKQAKRLLKQPGATALFAMAKEQTEGHCKSIYIGGLLNLWLCEVALTGFTRVLEAALLQQGCGYGST